MLRKSKTKRLLTKWTVIGVMDQHSQCGWIQHVWARGVVTAAVEGAMAELTQNPTVEDYDLQVVTVLRGWHRGLLSSRTQLVQKESGSCAVVSGDRLVCTGICDLCRARFDCPYQTTIPPERCPDCVNLGEWKKPEPVLLEHRRRVGKRFVPV